MPRSGTPCFYFSVSGGVVPRCPGHLCIWLLCDVLSSGYLLHRYVTCLTSESYTIFYRGLPFRVLPFMSILTPSEDRARDGQDRDLTPKELEL